jgi:hypothetical protein
VKLRVTSPNSSLRTSSQVSPRDVTYVWNSSGVSGSTHGLMPERVSSFTRLRSVAVLLPLPLPLSLASTTAIAASIQSRNAIIEICVQYFRQIPHCVGSPK